MTDVYGALRTCIAAACTQLLDATVTTSQVDIALRGCGARCAAPLAAHADAAVWAAALHTQRDAFRLFGVELIESVQPGGGHLLFQFTGAFYTACLHLLLSELPPAAALPSIYCEEGPHRDIAARTAYTQRRMWMLARLRAGAPSCPPVPAVQHALLLAAGLLEPNLNERVMRNRLPETLSALNDMLRIVPPGERPAWMRRCAHVAEGAARILYHMRREEE